jgi:hypothetical protein
MKLSISLKLNHNYSPAIKKVIESIESQIVDRIIYFVGDTETASGAFSSRLKVPLIKLK